MFCKIIYIVILLKFEGEEQVIFIDLVDELRKEFDKEKKIEEKRKLVSSIKPIVEWALRIYKLAEVAMKVYEKIEGLLQLQLDEDMPDVELKKFVGNHFDIECSTDEFNKALNLANSKIASKKFNL